MATYAPWIGGTTVTYSVQDSNGDWHVIGTASSQAEIVALGFTTSDDASRLEGSADLTIAKNSAKIAKKIVKLYLPVEVRQYTVTELSNNSGFDATTFMSKYTATYGEMTREPVSLTLVPNSSYERNLYLKFSSGSDEWLFSYPPIGYTDEGAVWGFTSAPADGTFTSTSVGTGDYVSKLAQVAYGSVGNVSKKIHVTGT